MGGGDHVRADHASPHQRAPLPHRGARAAAGPHPGQGEGLVRYPSRGGRVREAAGRDVAPALSQVGGKPDLVDHAPGGVMSRLAPAALVLSLLGTQACGVVEIDESCGPTQDLFKTVDLSSVGAAKSNLDYQMEFANGRRYFRWSSDLVEACSAEHVAVEFRMRQKSGHLPAGVQAVGRIFHYFMQPYEAVFDFTRTPDQNVFSARTTGGLEDVNWAAAQRVPTAFVEIDSSFPAVRA